MKNFDNEILKSKTVWTDDELSEECNRLIAAIDAMSRLGNRYDLVVSDLRSHLNIREGMVFHRTFK